MNLVNLITSPIVKKVDRNETPLILIERIGRTCYKSKSDYTEETASNFVSSLVNNGHYAMLEHAVFCFEVSKLYMNLIKEEMEKHFEGYNDLRYFNVTNFGRILISGNMRALNESSNKYIRGLMTTLDPVYVYTPLDTKGIKEAISTGVRLIDVESCTDLSKEEVANHIYLTMHITCDRGITHELVRHRNCAFAQESTRYCNYSKDRFGGISYVRPPEEFFAKGIDDWDDCKGLMNACSEMYMKLTEKGVPPQSARSILPTALKSEIVMTAPMKEWSHFLDLRYFEKTGKAHPQMKQVAKQVYNFFNEETMKRFSNM